MSKPARILGLDVGLARIGVAIGDTGVRIAIPHGYVDVDGTEVERIAELVIHNDCKTIVVGYPRNQSGDATQQTESVIAFTDKLSDVDATIVFQDESLTSVIAEQRLNARGGAFSKGDIDSEAAAIILQDYLEQVA